MEKKEIKRSHKRIGSTANPLQKVCAVCGRNFTVPRWRPNAKYCSARCQHISLRAENNLTCPCCGKMFHRKQSHIKRFKGNQGFYCSKECAKMGMRERMSGENNHQYGLRGRLMHLSKNVN